MLFQTTQFLTFFFIFYFFFLLFRKDAKRRLRLLLVSSYVFYAHWDWRFLGLIIFSTAADYYLGRIIEDSINDKRRKQMLILSVILNLSVLAFFKYFNFFLDTFYTLIQGYGINSPHWTINIILPVGISFYTFESMSYVIDVYKKHIKASRSFLEYSVFISFFPHLVAGPIIRPKIFFKQIREPFEVTQKDFHEGMIRFGIGIFKKVYLADILALHWVDLVFDSPENFSALDCLLAAYSYAFQIYLDFSAYSDMAIGLSKTCGIFLPENFNYPYVAQSLQDFWSRWHISLSTWLRDYLYIPLGGNRISPARKYFNIMTTMILGGLWHGANLTFVFWGFIHGLFIAASHLFGQRFRGFLGWFLTFHIVVLAWVYFRSPDIKAAHKFFFQIFNLSNVSFNTNFPLSCLLVLVICLLTHYYGPKGLKFKCINRISNLPWLLQTLFYSLVFISIIIGEQHFNPFIYFQF